MNHLPVKLQASRGIHKHSAPIAFPPNHAVHWEETPGAASRKDGSEVASSFYALNKGTRVYSAGAWAVPQGKAQGVSKDTLQPISAPSTEKFLARSHFNSPLGLS